MVQLKYFDDMYVGLWSRIESVFGGLARVNQVLNVYVVCWCVHYVMLINAKEMNVTKYVEQKL